MGGFGQEPTQFDRPRGLLYHSLRGALFVADSGNGRIQIFDPETAQLLDVWGMGGPNAGGLIQPWTLDADGTGDVYVVDAGMENDDPRVLKFDMRGELVATFWEQVQATLQVHGMSLGFPSDVIVTGLGGRTRVYVLDTEVGQVLVFDIHGRYRRAIKSEELRGALGLAVTEDAVYVGHNERQRIFRFQSDGAFVGAALGYAGPVSALAVHGSHLLVHTGAGIAPVQLEIDGAYRRRGFLWAGPFANYSHLREEWHRLRVTLNVVAGSGNPLAETSAVAHFQLFVYPSSDPQAEPGEPSALSPPWDGNCVRLLDHLSDLGDGTAGKNVWVRVPRDGPEAAFRAMVPSKKRYGATADNEGWEALDYVWIGAELWSDGTASPALSQMQLDFDHVTYLQHLPDIYGEHPEGRQLLGRLLSVFESVFEDVESSIGGLPELFDPAAAPIDWLPWLAGWLDVELEEAWDQAAKRRAIATAFELHGLRGTRRGLEAALRRTMGIDVVVEEPIVQASWWTLPDDAAPTETGEVSILGVTTMLVAAEAQGAVVGTTATLDGSHLIAEDQMGEPLFQDLAHRFIIRLYLGADFTPQTLSRVAEVLECERPAHATYHICTIEPCMRVGFQARLGIDTIVAGPAMPSRMDGGRWQRSQIILGGRRPGRLDRESRVGQTTRLGETPGLA
jgi:phage tail-like protein